MGGRAREEGREEQLSISPIISELQSLKKTIGVSMQLSRGDLVLLVDGFMALHMQMRTW